MVELIDPLGILLIMMDLTIRIEVDGHATVGDC